MNRLDKLIMRAKEAKKPRLKPWEKAIKENPYREKKVEDLLEMLSYPRDDWRQMVQALTCSAEKMWKECG